MRADVKRKKGDEIVDNNEVFDAVDLVVTVRNQHDIKEMDRLKIDGQMYIIKFINTAHRSLWKVIECRRLNE